MPQRTKNISGKLWFAFKLVLALAALWFIYRKVYNQENSFGYLFQLQVALKQPGTFAGFILVFVLMFFNWLTEAIKWKFMIRKIEEVSLIRSLEAVFSGITVSFFTPNRVGEYAGRVFHLKQGKRMQATIITIIESASQLLVTIIIGCIACMFYLHQYLDVSTWIIVSLRFLLIVFCLFCILFFFNLDMFERFFKRFRLSDYWLKTVHVFSLYSSSDLFKVIGLSFARYVIFTLQFYILLRIYGTSMDVLNMLLMMAMTFFVMAVVPTFTFAELGIRGAVSAYFFGKIVIDVLPVLNASFSLWFINLVLPALAGAFSVFHFRFEKNGK